MREYYDCPEGCPTPPLDLFELWYHMQWHRDEDDRLSGG